MLVVSKRSFQRILLMSGEAILRGPPKDPMWAFRSPPIMQGLRVRDDISRCSRSSKQGLYSAMGWPVSGMYAPIIVSCFVVYDASVILMARNLSLNPLFPWVHTMRTTELQVGGIKEIDSGDLAW